jgi:DNA-binding transcriptional LysR family regulator
MQLEALKIFCDVVRLASFSRAAKENDVSQSSASQVVLQLENRLGAKLLDRSKRPLTTTEAGRVYYEGCRTLLAHYQELENRVRQQVDETPLDGSVKVSSIYSVGLNHMVRIIANFREKHPQTQVKIEYHHPSSVLESVLDESSELGLISFPKKWPELVVLPWREERMVLAVPPGHRFADRAEILPEEIAGERFVAFDDGLPIRRAIDRFFRQYSIVTEIALEFDNIENIKRAVEIGSGVAILPEPTMQSEQKSGSLVSVRIKNDSEPLVRPLAIIHRKNRALSPVGQRFLQRLMDDSIAERSLSVVNGQSMKKPEGTDRQDVVSSPVSRVGEGNVVSI